MSRDLILHVGMDKTGTTAIQHMLHASRDAFLEQGVLVPQTGTWTDHSHHPFAFSALGMAGFGPGDLDRLFAELAEERAASGAGTVLLSTECLFKLPYRAPDNPFWDHLARHFDAVRVVAYLRRQDAWVESRHRHSIVSAKVFSVTRLSGPAFSDYRRFLDAWAGRFGRENVTVRPYERAQFVGGDIGTDFVAALGLPAQIVGGVSARRNATFFYQDLLFLTRMLDLGLTKPQIDRLNDLLLARPVNGRQDQTLISPAAARALVDRYADINAGIARDYMGRASGILFTDPPPDPATPWNEPELSRAAETAILDFVARHDPALHAAIVAAGHDTGMPDPMPEAEPAMLAPKARSRNA